VPAPRPAPHEGVGAPLPRVEDERFLRGNGQYVDDITRGALEVAFVRSVYAHARITDIDVSAVLDIDGVDAVYTWDDLPSPTNERLPVSLPHAGLVSPRTPYALARDEVNFVGEPIAMVVAQDRYVAEDACAAIRVSYEAQSPCVGIEQALSGEVSVHSDVPDNVAGEIRQGSEDVEEGLAAAPHRLDLDLSIERSMASPIEGRGVHAEFHTGTGRLTIHSSTQVPHGVRATVAHMLGCSSRDIDVVAPDVGGAFGVKGVRPWPEEVLVAWAARRLRRSVRWTEDRREHFVASAQEREQKQRISVGFDSSGRVLAYDVHVDHDIGAYSQYGLVVSQNTSSHLLGPYKIASKRIVVRAVYTNTVMVAPYRGAGRPEAVFTLERALDAVAQHLNLDRTVVRERNFIQPEEMPFHQGRVRGQDGRDVVYDSGDFPESLRKLKKLVAWDEFHELKKRAAREGRRIGIGLACYVENTGLGPYEGAHVSVSADGTVQVSTGLSTHGQGHYTSFAQIVAEELGVRLADVTITTGSTVESRHSAGTYASRGTVVSGTAIALASRAVRARALDVAGQMLEADASDLEIIDGTVRVKGNPSSSVPLSTVAVMANPLRYGFNAETRAALADAATLSSVSRPQGEPPGLEATEYFAPEGSTFANGMHAVVVETDIDTAEVRILRYCVVHDCGTVVNPTIVEGQVHGGVAQGIGGALYERIAYDDHGQMQNASFMDFLMPYASEIPMIETDHLETPSPLNPLGIKGAGEAGVIPASAALASAIEDAEGIPIRRMPISPSELFDLRVSARPIP
jgi:carbon-monoxide dehydrogenase large subunit